jgi:predicted NBD/HSP70 family sugar kinase
LFLSRLHQLIRTAIGQQPPGSVLGVGVAIPGSVDSRTGVVQAAENLGWINVHAGELLSDRLNVPFYCENNAKLSALAERWFSAPGDGAGDPFVFITLHSGVGTGIIIRSHLLHAGSPAAAEFGHVSLHLDNGTPCSCGNVGCWEQYASDFALVRLFHRYAGPLPKAEEVTSAEQVVGLARRANPAAVRAVRETAVELGLGLVSVVWALNPETIVLGDYAAEGWDLIREPMMSVLQSRVAPYALARLRIYPSSHGADATLLGAVALVLDRFFHRFDYGDTRAGQTLLTRASA